MSTKEEINLNSNQLSEEEKKAQYQVNLKKGIQRLFTQLKTGCSKKVCFNRRNCIKDIDYSADKESGRISTMTDKELITKCIKTVSAAEYIETLLCIDFSSFKYESEIVSNFDDWYWIVSTSNTSYTSFSSSYHSLNFCPKKAIELKKQKNLKEDYEMYNEIINFNKTMNKILLEYFSDYLKLNKSDSITEDYYAKYWALMTEENRIRFSEYLFKINFNFFNFIIVCNYFYYNSLHKVEIFNFFENYCILSNIVSKHNHLKRKSNYFTTMFVEYVYYSSNKNIILNNKKLFLSKKEEKEDNSKMEIDDEININSNNNLISNNKNSNSIVVEDYFYENINAFNNFLTILVLELTNNSEEPSTKDIKLLVGLLRIFEYFYFANKKYRMVSNEIFCNEKVNNYLSLKVQFLSYFKYHHNKSNEDMNIIANEAECFSFIKYYFLYDSGSKKDIISQYNNRLQHLEISNSFESIESLLALGGMHLVFEVSRKDLIKSTLDIIAKNLNFRKPLRVSKHFRFIFNFFI